MKKKLFGTLPSGEEIYLYTFKNDVAELTVMNLGAAVVSLKVFGRDVVGGFDNLDAYLADDSNQGVIVGRVANRIAGAKFVLDGVEYKLTKNDGENCLHGGHGFGHSVWEFAEAGADTIKFRYSSYDGEDGFPSKLVVYVRYTLVGSALVIEYDAIPYGRTPVGLTNHCYFNLDGFGGDIKNHMAVIYADRYTEVDDGLIPTGVRPEVRGTVFDFKEPHAIGERIGGDFVGYDHNYILNPQKSGEFLGMSVPLAAEVWNSDLKLNVYTDQPCVQFYVSNFLGNGPDFRDGIKQVRYGGLCLEAQVEPDSPNRNESIYGSDDFYFQITVYEITKR